MSDDPTEALRRRDEILQVMFWMRGEGLADAVTVADLRRFLDETAAVSLHTDLEQLSAAGLVEAAGEGSYRLSPRGIPEGGRRFADEFADYLHAGHGACSDPDCDCHALGPEACTRARI